MSVEAPQMMPAIVGIGKSLGNRVITNENLISRMDLRDWQQKRIAERPNYKVRPKEETMPTLIRPTGIEERHWVGGRQTNLTMAAEAATQARKMAGLAPSEIRGITTGTSTADFHGTQLSAMLQHRLGLRNEGAYKDVVAACVGFIHSLRDVYVGMTSPLGEHGPQIAIGSEVISKSISHKDPTTYPLFGDGAGAAAVKLAPDKWGLSGKIKFVTGADGKYAEVLGIRGGGTKHPVTHESLDKGEQFIHMDTDVVPREAVRRMAEYLELVMKEANVIPGDLSLVIPHQANLELIKAVAKKLDFPMEKVFTNINRVGNMSAAAIPVAMRDAWENKLLIPNRLIAMVSFGAGMTFGAAIIPITEDLPQNIEQYSPEEKAA